MNTNNGHILTDKQLVQKVLQGDTRAFGDIIKKTEKLVAIIVLKMIPDAEDQKDIAQDIYLRAFRKLSGFQFQSKLSTWIAQISYNTCVDHLRKKKTVFVDLQNSFTDFEDDDSTLQNYFSSSGNMDTEKQLILKERKKLLQTAMDQLPPLYKTLISLYHQESLSYEEIGQVTSLPSGTVKNYLFRARKNLKNSLLIHYKKEEL